MKNKISLIFIILFLIFSSTIVAAEIDAQAISIYYASDDVILEMAKLRNLDVSKDISTLRNELYSHHNLNVYTEDLTSSNSTETIRLLNSDNIISHNENYFDLSGNVELIIEDGSSSRYIFAERLVIDNEKNTITAIGQVNIKEEDSSSQITNDIKSDIATIFIDTTNLILTNAVTEIDSEDLQVFAVGDNITYDNVVSTTFMKDAFIASTDKDPHSSIRAKELIMLPESDLLATNAFLYIGRVPVLYLPVFMNPGSRMVGNPVFGISSERGMFLNTTFEIFGLYPKTDSSSDEDSTFSSLLITNNEDKSGQYSNGVYYTSSAQSSKVDSWARESASYLALIADAYQKGGLFFALDTNLNYFNKTLKMSSVTGLAISEKVQDRNIRYYSINQINYNNYGLNSTLTFPVHSDPLVKNTYESRYTDFSLLGGLLDQSFDSASEIKTYKIDFNTTYSVPTKNLPSWISKLEIRNLNMFSEYKWDSTDKVYKNTKLNLPSFSFTLSGTILNYSQKNSEKEETIINEENTSYTNSFISTVFPSLYTETIQVKQSKALTTNFGFKLTYQIKNNLSNALTIKDEKSTTDFSNSLSIPLSLSLNFGNLFDVSNTFTSTLVNTYAEAKDDLTTEKITLNNAAVVKSPYIGLTYKITTSFYEITTTEDNVSLIREYREFAFDKESIKTHSIEWAYTFGLLTPSVSYILPPLSQVISPKLTFKYNSLTLASSLTYKEKDTSFELSSFNFSASLNETYYSSSLSTTLKTNTTDLTPLTSSAALNIHTSKKDYILSSKITLSNDLKFSSFKDIKIVSDLKIPYLTIRHTSSGEVFSKIKNESINITLKTDSLNFGFWHNRIKLGLNTQAVVNIDLLDEYSSSFALNFGLSFRIEEFLDIQFSVKSINRGFYKYLNQSEPFFKLMIEDLLRSFDFFGNGRTSTQFVLDSMGVTLTHYMRDWDLSCKVDSRVVLSNNKYDFVNSVTVLVKWKLIEELQAEQNWKNSGKGWVEF